MESVTNKILDELDIQILNSLQKDASISYAEIAKQVNLSPPAIHARIKRLEKEGYIQQQVTILNQEKLGFELLTFIFISTTIHQAEQLEILETELSSIPEILECHCLTGEHDYLLKVVNRGRKELESFIRKLNKLGITRIQTSLALREVKNSTILPILENHNL
ncbi:Lrp/AsnC family transcriptional regulator [Rummeliibacillus sp. JY-2-4R]